MGIFWGFIWKWSRFNSYLRTSTLCFNLKHFQINALITCWLSATRLVKQTANSLYLQLLGDGRIVRATTFEHSAQVRQALAAKSRPWILMLRGLAQLCSSIDFDVGDSSPGIICPAVLAKLKAWQRWRGFSVSVCVTLLTWWNQFGDVCELPICRHGEC